MPTLYEALTERFGPQVAAAFIRALEDIRRRAEVQRLTAAIEARQIEEALAALHLDPAAYDELAEVLRQAHAAGGNAETDRFPRRNGQGEALVVRFEGRNPEAERWIAGRSSQLITRITDDQREAVRASLRDSFEAGVNPRTAALRIVGTIDRTTGRRVGGILGLTTGQEGYVRNARSELESGDPGQLRNYLGRTRRDKRFDRTIQRAIRDEAPVPRETIGRALVAYERRLLQLRGETIGRVEAMSAIQAARYEAYRQAIERGQVAANAVTKVWRSAGDLRVRHTHARLNGDSVRFREDFVSPSGARMRFPMDTALGAGPEEIVNCRCDCEYRIDFLANIR